ncbi:MAG: putative protease [Rhodospirillaceae bacterium]|nr:MAG: putative protease [Rhodospirillaceae bacterium]
MDDAARLGVDALILANIGLLDYASTCYPNVRRHLSVQTSAANAAAITYYAQTSGIRRVVLPRVLTIPEITAPTHHAIAVETEVFAYGGLCVMAEGRCHLSSYVTGQSRRSSPLWIGEGSRWGTGAV